MMRINCLCDYTSVSKTFLNRGPNMTEKIFLRTQNLHVGSFWVSFVLHIVTFSQILHVMELKKIYGPIEKLWRTINGPRTGLWETLIHTNTWYVGRIISDTFNVITHHFCKFNLMHNHKTWKSTIFYQTDPSGPRFEATVFQKFLRKWRSWAPTLYHKRQPIR